MRYFYNTPIGTFTPLFPLHLRTVLQLEIPIKMSAMKRKTSHDLLKNLTMI